MESSGVVADVPSGRPPPLAACFRGYNGCMDCSDSDNVAAPFRPADSPWFWGLLFSVMALIGLGLIGPKFDVRQRQIEGRFLGRRQAAIERWRRQAGLPEVDLAEDAVDRSVAAPDRIVPLWTLGTAATAAAVGCGIMLRREWLASR